MLRRLLGRISVRLLIVNLLVVLVPVAGLEFAKIFEVQLLNSLERDMRNQSALLRAEVEADLAADPSLSFFDRAANGEAALAQAARSTRTRIRLVDFDGAVVSDSHVEGPPEGVEPKAPRMLPEVELLDSAPRSGERWPSVPARDEVLGALAGTLATKTRFREKSPGVFLFLAEPVTVRGEVRGAVYVTRSTQPVLVELYRIRSGLVRVMIVALLLAGAVTLALAYDLSRPLTALVRASREVERGNLDAEIRVAGRGEVRELCEAFARLRDRLVARLRFAREFATDVAHEFKSPLTSIRGAAELLRDGAWEETASRELFLKNVLSETERLRGLTERLLLLGRIEAREQPRVKVDFAELVAAEAARFSDLELQLPAHAPVLGREADLRMAVANLLENAQHHRSKAPVKVALRAAGSQLQLSVENDGPGISPANQAKIFGRFFTTRREQGGSGLGLAIVRSVAEAHGGGADFTSEEGRTEFRLLLPLSRL